MSGVCARLRDARLSPQKARLVADQVRGMAVYKALNLLEFSSKKAAQILLKILRSAVANASHNQGLDVDELVVFRIFVDEARRLRRFMPRAKGRSNSIVKRNSHITVELQVNKLRV